MRFADIRQWAHDRNLVEGATPKDQMLKLIEEVGELADAIGIDDGVLVDDAIGDCVVVLTILAAQYEGDIEDCIEAAWQEIKDRKGKLINGVFVKDA